MLRMSARATDADIATVVRTQVKRVSMRGHSTSAATDLVRAIRRFVADDVRVLVELNSDPW